MNTLTNSAADLITVVILSREWHQQYFEISALTGMSSESICDFSLFFFWWHGYQAEGFPSTFIFCICSLLNEMLNFSWKLGKRKIFFSPTKLMLPLGSVRTLGIEHWFSMPIRNHWGCWRSSLSHASVGGSRGLSVLVTEESPLQALLMLSRIQGLGIMTPYTVGLTV